MHFLDSNFKFSTSNRYTQALIKNCLRLDWKKVSILIYTWILKNLAPKVFLFESLNLRVSKTLKKLFYVFVLLQIIFVTSLLSKIYFFVQFQKITPRLFVFTFLVNFLLKFAILLSVQPMLNPRIKSICLRGEAECIPRNKCRSI